jgi:hypothetical protein
LLELIISIYLKFGAFEFYNNDLYIDWIYFFDYDGNVSLFGYFFYTFYNYFLLIVALILFVSMLGAIVLVVNWSQQPYYSKMIYSKSFYYNKTKIKFIK